MGGKRKLLLLFFVGLFCLSAYKVGSLLLAYKDSADYYGNLSDSFVRVNAPDAGEKASASPETPGQGAAAGQETQTAVRATAAPDALPSPETASAAAVTSPLEISSTRGPEIKSEGASVRPSPAVESTPLEGSPSPEALVPSPATPTAASPAPDAAPSPEKAVPERGDATSPEADVSGALPAEAASPAPEAPIPSPAPSQAPPTRSPASMAQATPSPSPTPEPAPISVDFDSLLAINSDVAGWLYCPDSVISYPVVQGADNQYYLHHKLDGSYGYSGPLFLDVACSRTLEDENTLVYGHNMKDGSMFRSLFSYREQDYYAAHPSMWLLTPEGDYRVDLFAGFVTKAGDWAYQIHFGNADDREDFLNRALENSEFAADFVPGPEDRIVTLSTCDYSFNNARFVVLGALRPLQ
ncbi:MAG: class B sortase [Clostridia bacterium]|nr:class B sortase [Clostridia bacterium]